MAKPPVGLPRPSTGLFPAITGFDLIVILIIEAFGILVNLMLLLLEGKDLFLKVAY